MSDDDVGDYNLLKGRIETSAPVATTTGSRGLKRFRLTEGGYRKRFKSVRIEVGETAEQFVDRF